MQSNANSRGRLGDVLRPQPRANCHQGPASNGPLPKASAPTTKRNAHTDLLFPPPTARRFLRHLPLGLASRSRRANPLYSTVGRLSGPVAHDDRTAQVPSAGGHVNPEPLLEMHPVGALDLGLADGALAGSLRRSSITAGCRSAIASPGNECFCPMHWGSGRSWLRGPTRLMHELACQIPASRQLEGGGVRSRLPPAVDSADRSAGLINHPQQAFLITRFSTSSSPWILRFILALLVNQGLVSVAPGCPRSLRSSANRKAELGEWPQVGCGVRARVLSLTKAKRCSSPAPPGPKGLTATIARKKRRSRSGKAARLLPAPRRVLAPGALAGPIGQWRRCAPQPLPAGR